VDCHGAALHGVLRRHRRIRRIAELRDAPSRTTRSTCS
jgi:hypothetical protein